MRHSKYLPIILEHLDHLDKEKVLEDIRYLNQQGIPCRTIANIANKMKNRWNKDKVLETFEYSKECSKNKKTIFYDVHYYELSYNVTTEEAIDLINEFKSKKTTNLKGFIARHGDEKGRLLFDKFQKTSKSSTDKIKSQLKELHGEEWQHHWIAYQRKNSKRCYDFYIDRKLASNKDEALEMAKDYQLCNAGVNVQYYKNRGYSKEEIKDITDIINQKKKQHSRNREFLKKVHGDKWLDVYVDVAYRYRKSMEQKGIWIRLEDIDDWKKYKLQVSFLTRQSCLTGMIEDLNKRNNEWHLDHIFSIKAGYVNNVPAQVIASPVNLRVVSSSYNCSKREKCDIKLEDLYKNYSIWRSRNEN